MAAYLAKSLANACPWLLPVAALLTYGACTHRRAPAKGPALQSFQASDAHYFPPHLLEFFGHARDFQKDYPSLSTARSGIKVIEVRQLDRLNQAFNEANLSWSADGAFLSYERLDRQARTILVKNLTGTMERELAVLPRQKDGFLDGFVRPSVHSYNAGLTWAHDSMRFAFMSNGGVGQYNIYLGAIGVPEEAISQSPQKEGHATWNPRSDELVFVSGRSGNGDLYLIDTRTRHLTKLTQSSAVDIFPDWFPDGNRLTFMSGDANQHDIMIIERQAPGQAWGPARALLADARDKLRPRVSPDGRFVAFYAENTAADDGSWDIQIIPLQGSQALPARTIAKDVVVDLNTGPSWTPDGRAIFYVKRDPKVFNPISACDIVTGQNYILETGTRLNRDIMMSRLGVLSFRAQVGAWEKVFVALTNQGLQLRPLKSQGSIASQTASSMHQEEL